MQTNPGELHIYSMLHLQLHLLLIFQESQDGVRGRLPEPAPSAATAAGHNKHAGADSEAGKEIFQVDNSDS